MFRFLPIAALVLLPACLDETASGHGAENHVWQLAELDGAAWTDRATLEFDGEKISGKAPCNSFFTGQDKPYPWIEFGMFASTQMICPDMDAEKSYFSALSDMRLIEVSGDTLVLSNDAGREMVFKAAQDDG